jgi:hypothetical protein
MPALAKARALASVSPLRCHAFDASQYSSKDVGLRLLTSVNFAPAIRQQIPSKRSNRQSFRRLQPGADVGGFCGQSPVWRAFSMNRHVHWRSVDQRGCPECDWNHNDEKFTIPSQTHLFTPPSAPCADATRLALSQAARNSRRRRPGCCAGPGLPRACLGNTPSAKHEWQ